MESVTYILSALSSDMGYDKTKLIRMNLNKVLISINSSPTTSPLLRFAMIMKDVLEKLSARRSGKGERMHLKRKNTITIPTKRKRRTSASERRQPP